MSRRDSEIGGWTKSDVIEFLSEELLEFCELRKAAFLLKADIAVPDDILASLQDTNEEDVAQKLSDICCMLFGTEPYSISALRGKGTFHSLYRVVLPAARTRIFRTSIRGCPYRAFDFYIDDWATSKLVEVGVPTVPVYHVDMSRDEFPFDYEILGEAPGKPLATIAADGQTDRNLIFDVGRMVAQLHGVATQGFGMLDVKQILNKETGSGVVDTWEEYILLQLDRHIEICFNTGAIDLKDSKRINSAFHSSRHVMSYDTPSLLHGDLNNSNIFSDGKRITALIDWEDCLSGDPVFDIASWGTFIGNSAKLENFLDGYRSVRQTPEDFEFRYWLYYLRIILAKTVHRCRFRYRDKIPASDRIQEGLNGVERAISSGRF